VSAGTKTGIKERVGNTTEASKLLQIVKRASTAATEHRDTAMPPGHPRMWSSLPDTLNYLRACSISRIYVGSTLANITVKEALISIKIMKLSGLNCTTRPSFLGGGRDTYLLS